MPRGSNTRKYEARKWMGDDAYSWAIFRKGEIYPLITGLSKNEISYYKKRCAEMDEQRQLKEEC